MGSRNSSSDMRTARPSRVMPALATTTSGSPSVPDTWAIISATAAVSPTSHGYAPPRTPCFCARATTSAAASADRE